MAVIGKLVNTKGETIHKTVQKHRVHKIENVQNKETDLERILKNRGRVIKK
jgi:hypothetical protein